ncbi:MAG: hypothetical protein PWR01_3061 [Clostridiales bacterium]|jgi:hypothetical protein|nr:hypothetical protein [Clostridiales bacterium]MDN5281988.1 hypothetical protein [Candidatus Ozemobacter sp.]
MSKKSKKLLILSCLWVKNGRLGCCLDSSTATERSEGTGKRKRPACGIFEGAGV